MSAITVLNCAVDIQNARSPVVCSQGMSGTMAMTEKGRASIRACTLGDTQQSLEFTNDEHSLTFWVALRQHWPAVAWGLFMNLVREDWGHS